MKYIRTFESFKLNNLKPVNEELLGSVINFFKNMWSKATDELKKLGKNPSIAQIDQWIEKNPFNPTDDTYMLKSVMDEFKKKPTANDQDCLTLIDTILDPNIGALGKQGLQPFYDDLLKAFGNNLQPLDVITYYMERIRNRAIKDYKFAGGPDLKVGVVVTLDPKKKIIDLADTTHLPDFKKVLKAATDDKKKRDVTIAWVEKTLLPRLEKYATEVTDEEVTAFLKTKGIEPTGKVEYKAGDELVYLRDGSEKSEWDALTDDQKKNITEKPASEITNIKPVDRVEGDKFIFTNVSTGKEFTKTAADILMKTDTSKIEGQDDLVNTLKDLKTKNPGSIPKIDEISKLYSDPIANKDKIAEIEKAIGTSEA